ncbi:MAG: translocation/assembly module TamB domain-containing protein, partial [Muribaculaceae bacterium]|nr:translocation/assembly module TamB domain-containing protein [Muribaculaceae bacterium]
LNLYTDILAANDAADINLHFNPDSGSAFTGDLAMRAEYHPDLNPSGRKATLRFIPSTLYLNGAEWHVGRSYAEYYDKQLEIRDFNIAHENQHIAINGIASSSTDDMMVVELSDINLDYIFDTLNINYVSFGGTATGQAIAAGAFSPTPDAHTRNLTVRDLSYNHCVLGNAKLLGDFDIKNMRIGIKADIEEEERPVASVDGGIWLGGRDSLSFGIDADRVRVDFLQTFMQAFARDVSGRASGRGLLYGTFKDIDMTGRFFADTISMRVDYTNVLYSGRDSVFLHPGRVEIPPLTLYDKNKNSVQVSGELTHHYFHEPYFRFNIRNADHLLVYDTNPGMNPVWYGRIFGSGSGLINGTPEMVEIIADMTTEADSDFTFVLDDSMEATDYTFLTFTDSHKETLQRLSIDEQDEEDAIVAAFNKSVMQQNASTTEFSMDIRATV